jgi:RNA polymerase sigma-70 factor (ECF subfamily)
MSEQDAEAVARARRGDTEAFRVLVERHSRAVYRVAFRLTGSAPDAEDVVQDAFLKAYRQLDRFESRASFGTWMHRIATNCAVDLLRSRTRRVQSEDDETLERMAAEDDAQPAHAMSPERLLASAEVGERVQAGMARLSALERAAFVLRHLEGQTIEQIAAVLGIKDNAAKHCVFRAVRKMRIALAPFAE